MARVLVVDDDPDILKMAAMILGQAGHQVEVANGSVKAMELLDNGLYDLLISDANMPMYNGFQLIQTIRGNKKFVHMSIIMLTGRRAKADVEKAIKAGADDYVVKPIDPFLLIQKINTLFDKKPPVDKPEIRFAANGNFSQAFVQLPVAMEAVSELGIRVITTFPFKVGEIYDLSALFFADWGEVVPTLKVLTVDQADKLDEFRVQFVFLGAQESFLKKIRKWMFTHGASSRGVA